MKDCKEIANKTTAELNRSMQESSMLRQELTSAKDSIEDMSVKLSKTQKEVENLKDKITATEEQCKLAKWERRYFQKGDCSDFKRQ